MQFVMICEDKADSLALRMSTRDAHLAYIGEYGDLIKIAGPIIGDDGETMAGSVFVLEADSKTEIEAFNANDPYTRAGLFERVTIKAFRQVVPPLA